MPGTGSLPESVTNLSHPCLKYEQDKEQHVKICLTLTLDISTIFFKDEKVHEQRDAFSLHLQPVQQKTHSTFLTEMWYMYALFPN